MNPYGRAGRPDPPPHGTRARYLSKPWPCTCSRCRAANANYQAKRRTVARVRVRGQQLRLPIAR